MDMELGKKLKIAKDMNKLVYTKTNLSIDDNKSSDKAILSWEKGCQNKDYAD
jgi:hypothetical protein